MGLLAEDYPPPECELWAENWPAINLFHQLSTQWRVGAAGAVGLDYNVVFHQIDRMKLSDDDYDDLLGSIRVIEGAALKIMRTKD